MSFSTLLFTEKGRALQAKALAGINLNFTSIAMGSGSLGTASQITLTALIEPKVTLSIAEIKRDSNYASIKGNFSNADISTGFYWREIGIFAQDPDLGEILYCYGNAGTLAEYITPQTSGIIEKVVGISVIIGNVTNISANINETLVFATKDDIKVLENKAATQNFQTAGGTANAITLTEVVLANGNSKTFIVSYSNNRSDTTINGLPLYKPNTIAAPNLVAGKAVTVWYNTSGKCFFIKASAEGNATAADVLATKDFSNGDDIGIPGTMPNNTTISTVSLTAEGAEYTIPLGKHSGLQKVKAVITGLIASAIKAGTTVGGVVGTFTADATATASDMIAGKFGYRNGARVDGNIPIRGSEEYGGWRRADVFLASNPGRVHARIPLGAYLTGAGEQQGQMGILVDDPDFTPANFLATVNMFGLQGGIPVFQGDASAYYPAVSVVAWQGDSVFFQIPSNGYMKDIAFIRSPQPQFLASNILNTANIFGIQGTAVAGGRKATGVVQSSPSSVTFNQYGGGITVRAFIDLNLIKAQLTFVPSYVVCYRLDAYTADVTSYLASGFCGTDWQFSYGLTVTYALDIHRYFSCSANNIQYHWTAYE